MPEHTGRGAAAARAALAGNPSDGYGGAVLAVTIDQRRAQALARPADAVVVSPQSELVEAAVTRFARELDPDARASIVEWKTSIPRSVGLGGSSALVIATLRALCELHGVAIERGALADLALAVETEDLGIAAGLQDRVAQSFGGLTFMDFGQGGGYESLDPGLLPPLLVAWRTHTGEESGRVHRGLRERFERGEEPVRSSFAELARLARAARDALLAGEIEAFARCVDGSFDARARMMPLSPGHVEMIELARRAGASANYAGSGGAIVAVCRDEAHRRSVDVALRAAACETLSVDQPP